MMNPTTRTVTDPKSSSPCHPSIERRHDGMAIKNAVIKLAQEETLHLTRILPDEDRDEAIHFFLKECLKPHLDAATRDH